MPKLSMIALSGFRIREPEMLALGMKLPALAQRAAAIGALPSLGLLTLAGMTPPEWEISYHEPASVTDVLVHEVVQARPTLVAISALTASILEAYALANRLRAQGLLVAIGGLHVTSCSEEASRHADAVVVGDGEPVWLDLLRDAERGELKPIYRAGAPFDLSRSPQPRLDLLGIHARPRFTIQTARGCPLACEFCGASRLLGPFREKPSALVENELDAISRVHPRATIELADDNTFAGKRDPVPLLDAFERSGLRWFTECDWRLGERPDILSRLARAGCVQVLVGIESLVPVYSGLGAKRSSHARIMESIARIQEHGVAVIGCFVLGSDSDTLESIQELSDWLIDAPLADVQITIATPFPGTAMRARLAEEGRLLPDRGWESCTLFDATFEPKNMSVVDLERAFRNIVGMTFADGPAARREARRREIWANRYAVPV